ncbi:hypothetical protein [Streptomyces sp. NPDC055134]
MSSSAALGAQSTAGKRPGGGAVYAHVVQDTRREAVSHMDRLLWRRLDRE